MGDKKSTNKLLNIISFKNRKILTKMMIATTIVFLLITGVTQTFLYNFVENIVFNMELEKAQNAHATVYDTFTSASITNKTANSVLDERTVIISNNIAKALATSNYSVDTLKSTAAEMGADEIYVTDDRGLIVAGTDQGVIGESVDQAGNKPDRLKALDGETVVEAAPVRSDKLVQYISLPRIDEKGIVHIGFSSLPHFNIYEDSNPQNSIGQTKIGETGLVMAFNSDGDIKTHSDASLLRTFIENKDFLNEVVEREKGEIEFSERGVDYYGIFEKRQGLYIVAAMGVKEVVHKAWVVGKISMVFAGLTLLLVVIGVYILFKTLISKKIKILVEELEAVSNGDLTKQIPVGSNDEMGMVYNSFNNTISGIRNLIHEVYVSTETVSASSEELTASSQQIAHISQEMSKVVEEIALSSVDQAENTNLGYQKGMDLQANIEELSSLAKELSDISDKIESLKDEGVIANENVTEKAYTSNLSIDEVFAMVQETNESATRINDILNVINGIADQTSLLALNASIESARAGEAGSGFAIVAGEIKKLAEQSSESSNDIQVIIEELQYKSNATVTTMERVKELMDEQTTSVEDTKEVFLLLAQQIQESRERVKKLSTLETRVTANKVEIIEAFNNLAMTAENNAANAEQASASTQEQTSSIEEIANASNNLSELAMHLKDRVDEFKL